MEGISPTLALAALVLGLAGHPHDGAENPRQQSEHEQPLEFECAGLAIVVPGEDAVASPSDYGRFDDRLPALRFAAIPSRLNETRSVARTGSMLALDDPPPETPKPNGDIGALYDVPAHSASGVEDGSGCNSLAPIP